MKIYDLITIKYNLQLGVYVNLSGKNRADRAVKQAVGYSCGRVQFQYGRF